MGPGAGVLGDWFCNLFVPAQSVGRRRLVELFLTPLAIPVFWFGSRILECELGSNWSFGNQLANNCWPVEMVSGCLDLFTGGYNNAKVCHYRETDSAEYEQHCSHMMFCF